MFNILKGAPCGENFNYIILKMLQKNTFKGKSKM